jgi:hypothetical protein
MPKSTGDAVSSNFDFFAGQQAAPTAAAPTAVAPWQPILSPPVEQFAPQPRSSRRALVVVVVVALAAGAAGAVYLSKRAHPVPLPATLAGLPAVSIPKDEAHGFDSAKHNLGSAGVHDVSLRIYGNPGQQALMVTAGRTSSRAADFNQLANAMGETGQIAGVTVTPHTVTSGTTTLQCATVASQGETVAFCAWQGTHALLFGVGEGMSVQDTADALELARMDAALH